MYSPQLGRFGSRDAAWHEGSDSQYSYAHASPVNGGDPSGQIYVVLVNHVGFECGGVGKAVFYYLLDRNAPCEGYLVQKIEVYCMVQEDCEECSCPVFDRDASPAEADIVFYEAMKIPVGIKAKQGRADQSSVYIPKDSCGTSFTMGTIKFFCKDPADSQNNVGTGDLEAKGWTAGRLYSGKCEHKTSGGYISIDGKNFTPSFWEKQPVERIAWRRAGASWNCCRDDGNFVASFVSWDPRAWSGLQTEK